jgi:D-aminoacyl-tRNA deacylase
VIAIVVSRADRASEHIGDNLLDLADWTRREDETRPDADGGGTYYRTDVGTETGTDTDARAVGSAGDPAPAAFELRTFDALHLDLDRAAEPFPEPDLLIFVSRHAGDTGPLLTAHFTGNFGPAEYGGTPGTLAAACPNAHRRVVAALRERAPEGYEADVECTHHGPSAVGAPSMFVELGSGEEEWADPRGARAVAGAVLDLAGVDPGHERTVAVFGGGHYAPRVERVLRETDWRVGHVAADWALDAMADPTDPAVLTQALDRSGAARALVADDRPEVARALRAAGYRVVGETYLRETDGVPLALVERLEERLRPVEAGLRLGDPARETGPGAPIAVRDLPEDLLADAQGVDRDCARDAVRARALGFETVESGSRAAGCAAFCGSDVDFDSDSDAVSHSGADSDPVPEPYDALVADLVALLGERYDAVERREDRIVAREEAFDPDLARARGVPEGPAFGRLSRGDPVEVDGETIHPEAVRRERTREYPI